MMTALKSVPTTIVAQTWPQNTPPAETATEDKSQRWGHTIQQTDVPWAARLHGRTPDVQGAAQLIHEESQGS